MIEYYARAYKNGYIFEEQKLVEQLKKYLEEIELKKDEQNKYKTEEVNNLSYLRNQLNASADGIFVTCGVISKYLEASKLKKDEQNKYKTEEANDLIDFSNDNLTVTNIDDCDYVDYDVIKKYLKKN
jgi:hypothetical protein